MTKTIFALSLLAVAGAAHADIYGDSTGDMFGGAPSNLDISHVEMTNDATHLYISVTTVGFESWTKYMIFLNTGSGETTGSNAWNRPVNLNGQGIDHFIGSWVDSPENNSQSVAFNGDTWRWDTSSSFTNSVSGTTVTWVVSLAELGLGIGDSLLFDVATSGGGEFDTGIDHLSRLDMATDWWTNPSTAGDFLKYDLIPGPGAIALLGLAGLVRGGRRRL